MKKNRTIVGLLCIAASFGIAFGISPLINKAAAGKITSIQVKSTLPEGAKITEEDIVKVEIGKQGQSDQVVKDASQIVGKYAACTIVSGNTILTSMLTDSADNADAVLHTLDGDQQAISITIPSFAGGVSAKLKNGDIVSVIVTEGKQTQIPAALTYVQVITTTSAEGIDQGEETETGEEDALPATVTLLVNPKQAQLLAGYEANAKIHLSLRYRGDKDGAEKLLNAQKAALQEGMNHE